MASRNASFHEQGIAGVLLAPLKGVCIGVMILFGLMLAAWIIDWVFVFRVWPQGITGLQSILEQEITRTHLTDCWYSDLPEFATGIANFLYTLIFRVTGIHEMGTRFAESTALSMPDSIVRNAYVANFEGIQVAMLGTQLIGIRLATLIIDLPLISLAYAVAMADGLVQRSIRRVSGGRESSSIYHRVKYFQFLLVVTSIAIFLIWPLSINLLANGSISLGISAVLARVQCSYYKKHL